MFSVNKYILSVYVQAPPVNDPSVVAVPISYNVYYFGDNITNGSIPDIDVPMTTIDLPAVDSDVNVFVTAMNVFGSGPASNIVLNEISELAIYIHTVNTYIYACTYT